MNPEKNDTNDLLGGEERFRLIFNNINIAIHIHEIGPDGHPGRFIDVNDVACMMLQVPRDELLARCPLDFASPYHDPPLEDILGELMKTGTAVFETEHIRRDGVHIPVEIQSRIITLEGRSVVLSAIRDISKRKKVENALRFSNLILSTQLETTLDGILVVDEQGKILSYNQNFAKVWGIPKEILASWSDEAALSFVLESLADPEGFLARVRYLYDHKDEKSHEEVALKDGRTLQRYSAPLLGGENRYYGRIWYFRDISEQKKSEKALIDFNRRLTEGIEARTADLKALNFRLEEEVRVRAEMQETILQSLNEKNFMLQEIHHRVRNNLQVIMSLISLQKSWVTGKAAIKEIDEIDLRIGALAMVYEIAYLQQSPGHISMNDFFQMAISKIREEQSYQPDRVMVTVECDAGLRLDLDRAIPLSIIATELLANSFQHGFRGGREGTISIGFAISDGDYTFLYSDNGQGFPPGLDPENVMKGGLYLVRGLIRQLKGTLLVETQPQTRFVMKFPRET